jgi:polysaccharide pyruvyl transferase WcaK-like protein
MTDIAIIDTSIGTDNLGDEIIMDSVNDAIYEMFPDAFIFRVPSHDVLSRRSLGIIRRSSLCFVGGTNILASPGWRLRFRDLLFLTNAICLGVTWGAPDTRATRKRRLHLTRILAGNVVHSVRDTYTKSLLDAMGIRSVSTACPTMWKLTAERCATIPRRKSSDVLFTLTAYRSDPVADRKMIQILQSNYRNLYFFSQMHSDLQYMKSFNIGPVKIISPTIHGFNRALETEDFDVIGSRLHGGIRALQYGKRSLIIGIDHRSLEIAKDTGLPVLPRARIDQLEQWIHGDQPVAIKLPLEDIAAWKSQFTPVNGVVASGTTKENCGERLMPEDSRLTAV